MEDILIDILASQGRAFGNVLIQDDASLPEYEP